MLSVCIPCYNEYMALLVQTLMEQILQIDAPIDIVIIDDASEQQYRFANKKLENVHVKYIPLEENIGRSKIRNLFLQHTTAEHLLFLDCDVRIKKSDFLRVYVNQIKQHSNSVIAGGKIYEKPDDQNNLRWQYATTREYKNYLERSTNPYLQLITGNIVIPRVLLQQTPFNESISDYGHEDTLLGFEYAKKKVSLVHIDNEVVVSEFESNNIFVSNTRTALETLRHIRSRIETSTDFHKFVPLLKWYENNAWAYPIYAALGGFVFKQIEKRMLAGKYNGRLFDLYKLLYYHKLN